GFHWQTLLDLGTLWAGHKDYGRALIYFQRALDMSRTQNNRGQMAHSLNAIGNLALNQRRLAEALDAHQQALAIFTELDDRRGKAQTLDYLSMAALMAGDVVEKDTFCRQAAELFAELDDRQGLVSTLATQSAAGWCPSLFRCVALPPTDLDDALARGEQAYRLAQTIGWQAGLACTAMHLGLTLAACGRYGRSLQLAHECLERATAIGHQEWSAGARSLLGWIHADLYDAHGAREHLEQGRVLAQTIGSEWWLAGFTVALARTELLLGDLQGAVARLRPLLPEDGQFRDVMDRNAAYLWAELCLEQGEPNETLRWVQYLLVPQYAGRGNAAALHLKGEALATLDRRKEAEEALHEAGFWAAQVQAPLLAWRIHATWGRLLHAHRNREAARAQFEQASTIIEMLAASLAATNEGLRHSFLTAPPVQTTLAAASRMRTSNQQEAHRYAGLTTREREVAALIVQGKSNREIANALVLSQRTVATHVRNLLVKLNVTSRAQVAAWASEKGLGKAVLDE
ncbi:MAG TPA: response regulator transcription factor, partial [Ktedonobacteraceae bacterium]